MMLTFKLRRDTAANWASANPVLAAGEPGVETDTRRMKYGDGAATWNDLAYSVGSVVGAITPTTVAATGSLSGTGFRAIGDIDSTALAKGGPGLELTYLASQGFGRLFAYDRTKGVRIPIAIDGSQLQLKINGTTKVTLDPAFGNYANDPAAAAGGVPVNGLYRNGSVLMIRVA